MVNLGALNVFDAVYITHGSNVAAEMAISATLLTRQRKLPLFVICFSVPFTKREIIRDVKEAFQKNECSWSRE
jgi:CTP synthase (UTP-ammonia lyase)